jgi:molybdopterin biosynthesis enzyme
METGLRGRYTPAHFAASLDNSAMDGFAIRTADFVGRPGQLCRRLKADGVDGYLSQTCDAGQRVYKGSRRANMP